jgi:hypothetical protein
VRDKNGKIIDNKHPDFEKFSDKYSSASTPEYSKFFDENKYLYDENNAEYQKKYDELFRDGNFAQFALTQRPSPRIF